MKLSVSSVLSFLAFTLMPLFSTSILSYFLVKNQDLIHSMGYLEWFLLSILLTITSSVALSPPTFLAVVFGYFLGFQALPFLLFINFGAISLVYLLYKYLDFRWVDSYLNHHQKVQNLLQNIRKDELKIIFFAKLSPVLPFALTNLTFAVSGASIRHIVLGGFMGMLPRTLLAIYTGSQAREISEIINNPTGDFTAQLIVFGLVLVSVFGLIFVMKKYFKPS
ncbi:MAG: VTT domain-containing protein [Bacteroidetes bacterium]|nr:VTT domain-containing protein [Bacteroidota bacterium]